MIFTDLSWFRFRFRFRFKLAMENAAVRREFGRRCVGRGGREAQAELEAARGVWVRAALRRTRREEKPSQTWSGTTPACAYGGAAYLRICVGHGGREGELGAACGVWVRCSQAGSGRHSDTLVFNFTVLLSYRAIRVLLVV